MIHEGRIGIFNNYNWDGWLSIQKKEKVDPYRYTMDQKKCFQYRSQVPWWPYWDVVLIFKALHAPRNPLVYTINSLGTGTLAVFVIKSYAPSMAPRTYDEPRKCLLNEYMISKIPKGKKIIF